MESILARKLHVDHPVAVLLSEAKPASALEHKSEKHACLIPFVLAAAKGKTAVFERSSVTCGGGKVGLGFGHFPNYPGGIEYFLSTGKEGVCEGEGYRKTPALGAQFVEDLPITDIPARYIIFKPLSQVDEKREMPSLVIFYVNVNQLAALTVLANYDRATSDNVLIPSVSGCQSIFLLPYAESRKKSPKAVIGMMDITVRPMLDTDKVTFTVPFAMFEQMERNTEGSFLGKSLWTRVEQKMTRS